MPLSRHFSHRRRALLAGTGALALSGCFGPRKIEAFCPADPRYTDPLEPLTIDVHAHVFNATDLQVKEFLHRVMVNQSGTFGDAVRVLAGLLQDVSWDLAPSAAEEIALLKNLEPVLAKCDASGSATALDGLRDRAYRNARSELNAALRRSGRSVQAPQERDYRSLSRTERRLATATAQADFLIHNLPESRTEYLVQREERASIRRSEPTVQGMIDFVIQNFQYRYVTVQDYLDTYSRGGSRKVDLMIVHMVDYDWWLAQGKPTRTPLKDQVGVMEQIALRTGGRVHGFAPFDPLRELLATQDADSSLALVQDAVRNRGCIGVKLYPPMGFAAWGNEKLGEYWKGAYWLPPVARQAGFGQKLDDAIGRLFRWALEEDVPIMAHTNVSNGPTEAFKQLATAGFWRQALERFDAGGRSLRINFGHFGATEIVAIGPDRTESFIALMGSAVGAPGRRAFADASYFSDVLNEFDDLLARMAKLYQRDGGVLAKRLMFGTDWHMCLVEPNVGTYLTEFERLYQILAKVPELQGPQWRTLGDDFFGRNAADYLGLRKGERTRARLEAFYGGRVTPGWMTKVDKLVA